MTIGIGGWGPRRKPMALVRAILRSDLKDLTLVSWGGADVGLLLRAGKVRKLVYAFVSLDSVPLEPNFQKARQEGTIPEVVELDEGMFQAGLRAAAQRLPFLPMRAGLGSDVLVNNPWIKTVESPYRSDGGERRAGGRARPSPRRRAGAPQPGGQARQRDVPRPRPLLRRPVLHGRRPRLRQRRADRRHGRADRRRAGPAAAAEPDDGQRRGGDAERRPLHDLHARLRARRKVPAARTPPRPVAPTRTGRPSRNASSPATRPPTSPLSRRSPRSRNDRRHPRRRVRRRHRRCLQGRRRDLRQPDGHAAHARRPTGQADQQPRPGDLRR